MTKREKIIKLLQSGNFTIAYHDNEYCQLYKGKKDYDHLPEKGGIEFEGFPDGYIPVEIQYLVEALGGKVETI